MLKVLPHHKFHILHKLTWVWHNYYDISWWWKTHLNVELWQELTKSRRMHGYLRAAVHLTSLLPLGAPSSGAFPRLSFSVPCRMDTISLWTLKETRLQIKYPQISCRSVGDKLQPRLNDAHRLPKQKGRSSLILNRWALGLRSEWSDGTKYTVTCAPPIVWWNPEQAGMKTSCSAVAENYLWPGSTCDITAFDGGLVLGFINLSR